MTQNAESAALIKHPKVDGSPVLIGDRLRANIDIETPDGWGPNRMDVDFTVSGILHDRDDTFEYHADDGECYYTHEVTGRVPPTTSSGAQ